MICLDIPVPRCVQELLRRTQTPVCFPKDEDGRALGLIRRLGEEFHAHEHEIEKACCLASGLSDIIIILYQQGKRQNYQAPFDQFVNECPTLQAVDELVRFCSKGSRSIHTVTVLDALSFTPDTSPDGNRATRCHQLIKEILELKKPRVVICCGEEAQKIPIFSKPRSEDRPEDASKVPFRDEMKIETAIMIVIRSFHPSASVNYRKRSPYTRILLILQFVQAFAELDSSATIPVKIEFKWIKILCDEAHRYVHVLPSNIRVDNERSEENNIYGSQEIITASLLRRLRAIMGEENPNRIPISMESRQNAIVHLLSRLLASNYSDGALGIVKLCLILRYYPDLSDETKDDMLAQLCDIGSRQDCFLPSHTTGPFPKSRR